jgi:hypothetical protein
MNFYEYMCGYVAKITVRPFFPRSASPSFGVGDGMRKKDTEIPPKRVFI